MTKIHVVFGPVNGLITGTELNNTFINNELCFVSFAYFFKTTHYQLHLSHVFIVCYVLKWSWKRKSLQDVFHFALLHFGTRLFCMKLFTIYMQLVKFLLDIYLPSLFSLCMMRIFAICGKLTKVFVDFKLARNSRSTSWHLEHLQNNEIIHTVTQVHSNAVRCLSVS